MHDAFYVNSHASKKLLFLAMSEKDIVLKRQFENLSTADCSFLFAIFIMMFTMLFVVVSGTLSSVLCSFFVVEFLIDSLVIFLRISSTRPQQETNVIKLNLVYCTVPVHDAYGDRSL